MSEGYLLIKHSDFLAIKYTLIFILVMAIIGAIAFIAYDSLNH